MNQLQIERNFFLKYCHDKGVGPDEQKKTIVELKKTYNYRRRCFNDERYCTKCSNLKFVGYCPIKFGKIFHCEATKEFYGLGYYYCNDNENDYQCNMYYKK